MKWIEIAKAKPRFTEDYLVMKPLDNVVIVTVGHLKQTTQTESGLIHTFATDHGDVENPTHIALITLPGAKEKEVG